MIISVERLSVLKIVRFLLQECTGDQYESHRGVALGGAGGASAPPPHF